jgi:hypothetical protein
MGMDKARLKLVVAAVLFAGWIGYLAYLVVGLAQQEPAGPDGKPVVLSRPQFLVATLVVTAEVEDRTDRPTRAIVKAVHWPQNAETAALVDQTVEVRNLARSEGLNEAGRYILPLWSERDTFQVAPTPPSPGYPPGGPSREAGPSRVYLSTPHTQEQLEQIRACLKQP